MHTQKWLFSYSSNHFRHWKLIPKSQWVGFHVTTSEIVISICFSRGVDDVSLSVCICHAISHDSHRCSPYDLMYTYIYIHMCVWSYLILYITYMMIWFFAVGVWWLSMPKLGRASILCNGGPLDPKVTSSLIFFYNCVSHCEPIFVNNANFNNGDMPLIFCIGKLLRYVRMLKLTWD